MISLTNDVTEVYPVHLLTSYDSLDLTAAMATHPKGRCGMRAKPALITPRQKTFEERIRLPNMKRYPLPPNCSMDDPEDMRRIELMRLYREFVLDMHSGVHMTQLTANQEYSDIHCQIFEDMQTLKVDQGSGCIIEFPLCAVSKVYRIVKNDDRWFNANSPRPMTPCAISSAEHIVVVEFVRRKLAFVLSEIPEAQGFLVCMELLIRRARECRAESQQVQSKRAKRPEPGALPVFVRGERLGRVAEPESSGLESPFCVTRCKADSYFED
eukprot:CAMPEP_0194496390 /NCGR_PEP_ID=MMETSP0253-20130528/13679_1 /TAXON_ID=2966 /ORGANISM="Noctiluca scintillans" /LENGTH=268 /DNA_ID=CAMNT_0039337779 /DNA_START=164 /DNA_END=970 /DNA_ORIENTATION=+